jgi:hypothetical protein
MKTFKRLLQITRIVLLAVLAVYAAAALLFNLSDPGFESAEMFEGESHRGSYCNTQATTAGNGLARNDFTEASLAPR